MRLGLGNGGVNDQIQAEVGESMRSGIEHKVEYYEWTHYVILIDLNSNASAGTVKVYVNGV